MKKLHVMVLSMMAASSMVVHSENNVEIERFKKQYHLLDNEIRIVEMKDFMKSSFKNDKDQTFMQNMLMQMKKMKEELDTKGYVEKLSPPAQFLLYQIKDDNFRIFAKTKAHEGLDTLEEIPMAYDYNPINPRYYDAHWGFSHMGTYRTYDQGDEREGWTGIVEAFEKDGLICTYTEHNTKLAHGGNELIKELITYNINNHPTIEMVEGNSKGYAYIVSWFQKDFDKKIECGSFEYSKETLEKVKRFAMEIDKKSFKQ